MMIVDLVTAISVAIFPCLALPFVVRFVRRNWRSSILFLLPAVGENACLYFSIRLSMYKHRLSVWFPANCKMTVVVLLRGAVRSFCFAGFLVLLCSAEHQTDLDRPHAHNHPPTHKYTLVSSVHEDLHGETQT